MGLQIAAVGVDTYLKMLLTDNFVHTDLHPGNILARMAGTAIQDFAMKLQIFCVKFANSDSVYRFDVFLILEAFWVRQMPTELSDCYGSGNENGESSERLQLVLLDFGLAEELPPQVRYHFISFIINIGAANGKRAVCWHLTSETEGFGTHIALIVWEDPVLQATYSPLGKENSIS